LDALLGLGPCHVYGVEEDSSGFPEKIWMNSEEEGLNGNAPMNRADEIHESFPSC